MNVVNAHFPLRMFVVLRNFRAYFILSAAAPNTAPFGMILKVQKMTNKKKSP